MRDYNHLADFDASVARYKDLPPGQRPEPDYHWWTPEESLEGASYLRSALHQNPGATLRVYQGLTEDGLAVLWHIVVDAQGTVLGGFNESFPCPPRCG